MTKKSDPTRGQTEDRAKQFIDEVIEVDRRHGNAQPVSSRTYKRAIRDAASAARAVQRAKPTR